MNRFSFSLNRKHNRFASPLAGTVYDNKKFQQSCYIKRFDSQHQLNHISDGLTSTKSTPYSLQKVQPCKHQDRNPEMKSEVLFRSNKILELSKRLSNPVKARCSKNKWASCQSASEFQGGYVRRTMQNAIKFDNEISSKEQYKPFKFPDIRVFVLDTLGQGKEPPKWVKLQLKRYFQIFFKGTLMGRITQQLSDLIERHIDSAAQGQQEKPHQDTNNKQGSQIVTKNALYEKLHQLQKWGHMQELYELIRQYCLPKKQLRSIFLNDVLNLLSLQIYEEFGLNRQKQYTILNQDGTIVKDFVDIKFSTKKLYMAEKARAQQLYYSYQDVNKYRNIFSSKNAFRQTLKQNFRQQILAGSYQKTQQFSPHQGNLQQMRHNVSRAQKIINFKNDKTSFGRTRLMQYLNRQKISKKQKEHSPSEGKNSPKKKVVKYNIEQQHISSVDEKITQQFRKLKRFNDYEDSQFKNDQSCKNKIQLRILVKESIYFKTKNMDQRTKILECLKFISEGEKLEQFEYKTINEDDYRTMRKIISCMGEKSNIVDFVTRYLGFDQYGELSQEKLQQVLTFVLRGQGKTEQVILKTIWGWLEKNGVINNNMITRINMQMMYERNKMVYYFLISLIFGTGQTSALQLAQGILI